MEKINGDDLVYPLIVDNMMHGPIVHHGLSKREYFAAEALKGLLSMYGLNKDTIHDSVDIANDLIEELNKH